MAEVLNCDASECGHVEDVGKITQEMVDMPCPKCGSNLLTYEDWIAWQPYSPFLHAIDGMDHGDGVERTILRIGLHGPKTTIEFERAGDTLKESSDG